MQSFKEILKSIAAGALSPDALRLADQPVRRVTEFFDEKDGRYINNETGAELTKEQFQQRNAGRKGVIVRTVVFKNFSSNK